MRESKEEKEEEIGKERDRKEEEIEKDRDRKGCTNRVMKT